MRREWSDKFGRYAIEEEDGKLTSWAFKGGGWCRMITEFGGPAMAPEVLRLAAALRALAGPLVEAASGSLEGPDIEEILEKAGLIAWTVYDADNPEHVEFLAAEGLYEIDDGDRFWRLTDFGKEVLGHG